MKKFADLQQEHWKEVLYDTCKEDYNRLWFRDGNVAKISHDKNGMTITSGPEFLNDEHHEVLWTKAEFKGDLKIEYDFTRLDNEKRCVNILYMFATGIGDYPYVNDIGEWRDLRSTPAMSNYYSKMNLYHISYAAFTNDDVETPGYIRARRYMGKELEGTELDPSYDSNDFFESGVEHHFTVIKKDQELFFHITNNRNELVCYWNLDSFPSIDYGRIGIRQMHTRQSRYRNFSVSTLE